MPLVETLRRMFTADERAVYRCDACSETFEADLGVDDPSCPACGAGEVRQVNRV